MPRLNALAFSVLTQCEAETDTTPSLTDALKLPDGPETELDVPVEPEDADEATPPEVVAVLVRPFPALAAEADDVVVEVALVDPPPALADDAPPLPDTDEEELPFPLDAELDDPEFESDS